MKNIHQRNKVWGVKTNTEKAGKMGTFDATRSVSSASTHLHHCHISWSQGCEVIRTSGPSAMFSKGCNCSSTPMKKGKRSLAISCSSAAALVLLSLRHQPQSTLYLRRGGERVDKRPLPCSLSPLTWNHISIHTLIIPFDEKRGSSTAAALAPEPIVSPSLAGKMQGFSLTHHYCRRYLANYSPVSL
ncbi:uncharacterized protein LOC122866258 isoform X1 [Siniperca chuatsi]|uniref:uncharacterized protein LOC122866258 isoform X1 n=1 Tax=Siniperca chuatsi TaxID=119488 RepID=UPI001CE15F98|nr:uncharacterized protein LOC122866258 isoform X1 [Siniperca chuatsi]